MRVGTSGATSPSYAATPSGVSAGQMWYDSTTNQVKYQSNSGVQTIGTSTGGISTLTVAAAFSVNGNVAGSMSNGTVTLDLSNTGVTAGTYAKVTVDTKGRVTAGAVSLTEAELPVISTAGKVSGNAITSGVISGSTSIATTGNLITSGVVSGTTMNAATLNATNMNATTVVASTISGSLLQGTTVSGSTVQASNLRVYSGAQYVQFTAQAMSSSYSLALPTADGISGQVLSTNGSGILNWTTPSAGIAGTISIGQGGTAATSFSSSRIIASNSTGTALVSFGCSLNQVISFDASGMAQCSSVSSLAGTGLIANGGNSTGAAISLGTNDNFPLQIKTNNTVAMTISQGGNVGIGTSNPATRLRVDNGNTTFNALKTGNAFTITSSTSNGGEGRFGVISASVFGIQASDANLSTGRYLSLNPYGGNVGIGLVAPAEALEVSGALRVGTTSSTNAGTIRWDGTNFSGYNGTAWVNFVPSPAASGACDTVSTYSSSGTYAYTVPASFGTITVRLWGGGGGGTSSSGVGTPGSSGSNSSISSLGLSAAGGVGGTGGGSTPVLGTGGSGGTASGGSTNTNGAAGSNAASGGSGAGGNSPNGGNGGGTQTSNSSTGIAGASPGGGGSGARTSSTAAGGGGGSGAYVEKIYTQATLNPGASIADVVVGGGGAGGTGTGSGGAGAVGRITISCASAGAPLTNDRGILFMNTGTYATDTGFVYDAAGRVGIGISTPTAPLHVSSTITSGDIAIFQSTGSGGAGCTIAYNGASCSSDVRFKENISNVDGFETLNELLKVRPVHFSWKQDPEHKKQTGFIAQELEQSFPEFVKDDSQGKKQVNYANFVSVLTASIQELYKRMLSGQDELARQNREISSTLSEALESQKKLEYENKILKNYICAKDPSADFCQK